MGEIVGIGLISHVPTIMLPESERRGLNNGREISLVPGLRRLKTEVMERLRPDTVIVIDTHWASTVEFLVTSHSRRSGLYTSEELPRGMSAVPYDLIGDPVLAEAIADEVNSAGSFCTAISDPYLPIHYPTVNLLSYLQADIIDSERWISISTVQTGESADFLTLGRAIERAVSHSDRRVVILGSGGMSHRFWPLSVIRDHESSDLSHIHTQEARAADEQRLEWMRAGLHSHIVDSMDEYRAFAPEGRFGHYLAMIAAVGGRHSSVTGEQFSDYENAVGTGQVHVWFERPESGWPRR